MTDTPVTILLAEDNKAMLEILGVRVLIAERRPQARELEQFEQLTNLGQRIIVSSLGLPLYSLEFATERHGSRHQYTTFECVYLTSQLLKIQLLERLQDSVAAQGKLDIKVTEVLPRQPASVGTTPAASPA